jgi:hypothetical protein
MAQHDVKLSIEHPIPIGNVDVIFEVRQGNTLLGTARLSRGGIDWKPRNARRAKKTSWSAFAEWMES